MAAPAPGPAPDGRGYRPHLDGIRAGAVGMVILFHLGYEWIPGGFVGVDVFFVLSGYLITGVLLAEATDRGAVRLGRFYARRVRRLVPASFAVLVAVTAAGALVLDPVRKQALGWDVTLSAISGANWRFALAGGDYFAPGDVPSPLVHYWSLAVEEQFYLVWPALFLGLYRLSTRGRGRAALGRLLAVVLVLVGASAAASVALAGSPLGYYGTHARAYQLLAGAALALAARHRAWAFPDTPAGRAVATAVALAGAAAVAGLALTVDGAAGYPGGAALAVTAASLLLLAGLDLAPVGWAARLVGNPPAAFVGRLSYSLYLWHWPVIVFAPLLADRYGWGPWARGRAVPVLATGALALASYLLVERPVRFRLVLSARPAAVVAVGLVASLAVGVAAYPVFQPRNAWEQAALKAAADNADPGSCPYLAETWPAPEDAEPCVFREGDGPTIALVGDSHAQQWQPALAELAERSDARIVRATRGGCPANDVLTFNRGPDGRIVDEPGCVEWRHQVDRELIARYDPDVVLVVTRSHVRGLVADGHRVGPGDPAHLAEWTAGWGPTLRTLTSGGAKVVVSELLPTLPESVPACLIRHGEGVTDECDFPAAGDATGALYDGALAGAVEDRPGVALVDLPSIPCPAGVCPAVMGGTIVHRDDNHLTATFVRSHAADVGRLLRAAGAPI